MFDISKTNDLIINWSLVFDKVIKTAISQKMGEIVATIKTRFYHTHLKTTALHTKHLNKA